MISILLSKNFKLSVLYWLFPSWNNEIGFFWILKSHSIYCTGTILFSRPKTKKSWLIIFLKFGGKVNLSYSEITIFQILLFLEMTNK